MKCDHQPQIPPEEYWSHRENSKQERAEKKRGRVPFISGAFVKPRKNGVEYRLFLERFLMVRGDFLEHFADM